MGARWLPLLCRMSVTIQRDNDVSTSHEDVQEDLTDVSANFLFIVCFDNKKCTIAINVSE